MKGMKNLARHSRVLLLSLVLALAVPGLATASTATVPHSEDEQPEFFDSEQDPKEVEAYWTPERMRDATPAPFDAAWDPDFSDDAPPPDGEEKTVDPDEPLEGKVASALAPLGLRTSSDLTPAWWFWRGEVTSSYTQWPHSTHGRVFFTHGRWHTNHSCSATVVNASNRRTVWTAGHCVHSGAGGAWHYNWVFVPSYRDGTAPRGVWSARQLWSLAGWVHNGYFRYDLGAVRLWPNSGWNIQNLTGGQGLWVNGARNVLYNSFGYPAGWPFNGQRMIHCIAPWATNDSPGPWFSGPRTMGKGCDVTGGASGGGWLSPWGSGGGYLRSVHSYKYHNRPQAVFGPYHGSGAWNLYWAASG